MYPKIKDVYVDKGYILVVNFENGVQKKYDFNRNFDNPVFRDLKNEYLFKQVKVDTGGYGISWNDDLDLSENELWKNGVTCN
ncbi:MAG: DUF2442 domain-containing protein [Candidatus Aminicenantes bacterium]|nr:DUF2442 domain-containing protein [Candidatus Aminicenantes bacterium]